LLLLFPSHSSGGGLIAVVKLLPPPPPPPPLLLLLLQSTHHSMLIGTARREREGTEDSERSRATIAGPGAEVGLVAAAIILAIRRRESRSHLSYSRTIYNHSY
jgi:hypothetical protein